jgi:hypothetical protein
MIRTIQTPYTIFNDEHIPRLHGVTRYSAWLLRPTSTEPKNGASDLTEMAARSENHDTSDSEAAAITLFSPIIQGKLLSVHR